MSNTESFMAQMMDAPVHAGARTSIPMSVEPVSVGTERGGAYVTDGKYNDKGAFPHRDKAYTIRCRLRIKKYLRQEAYDRCMEIHGTTFDGVFQSGGYYVFWSNS